MIGRSKIRDYTKGQSLYCCFVNRKSKVHESKEIGIRNGANNKLTIFAIPEKFPNLRL